jgi:hypothetical protein
MNGHNPRNFTRTKLLTSTVLMRMSAYSAITTFMGCRVGKVYKSRRKLQAFGSKRGILQNKPGVDTEISRHG